MRATLVTTLLSSLVAFGSVSSAFADESSAPSKCSGLAVLGVQGGYPFQDLGFDASNSVPVMQDMLAVTCGHFTADWWSSTQLSGGDYGHRGAGDEHDLELTYANSAQTPIGTVNYSLYAAYFAIDLGKGLGNTADDVAEVYGEVSRSLAISKSWTLSPFVRYMHVFPMSSGYDSFDWVRGGVRLNGPLSLPIVGEISTSTEVAHTTNFNPNGVVQYRQVWRGEINITKQLDYGWSGTVGVKFTEHVGTTPLIQFAHAF